MDKRKLRFQVDSQSDSQSSEQLEELPRPVLSQDSEEFDDSQDEQLDEELCMAEIEDRIRKLQKHLSSKKQSQKMKECQGCKALRQQNRNLKVENQELRRRKEKVRQRSKERQKRGSKKDLQIDQLKKISKESKLKLQKQIQLLQIIERLRIKLKTSIARKKRVVPK